jgi:hypothetical protein
MEVLVDLMIEWDKVDVFGDAEGLLVLLEEVDIAVIPVGILSEVHVVHASQIFLEDRAIVSEEVEVGSGLNEGSGTLA